MAQGDDEQHGPDGAGPGPPGARPPGPLGGAPLGWVPSQVSPPPPRPGRPPHRRLRPSPGMRLLGLLRLAVVAGLGAVVGHQAVVHGLRALGDDGSSAARDRPATTTTIPETTTTTLARAVNPSALAYYCDHPGEAWPEVPPQVAGRPARTYVGDAADDPGNGAYLSSLGNGVEAPLSGFLGGSTVLSPQPDGQLTSERAILGNTRSVTCLRYLGIEGTGQQCAYTGEGRPLPRPTYELAASRWEVVVYELHSGGVLHRGEVRSLTSFCPTGIMPAATDTQVIRNLDQGTVLDWLGSHFLDGAPS